MRTASSFPISGSESDLCVDEWWPKALESLEAVHGPARRFEGKSVALCFSNIIEPCSSSESCFYSIDFDDLQASWSIALRLESKSTQTFQKIFDMVPYTPPPMAATKGKPPLDSASLKLGDLEVRVHTFLLGGATTKLRLFRSAPGNS